ncbi:amino acid adenylation domain-containing protein [Chlorogloeopsis sp. ULAP02]|uniref:non-ribosomal peptide synthetase family protein n=1 Tax=Chlorogloeopsis sp. ULAP02 TaxID=3107926 RepID=UPI00313514B4
MGMQNVEDFYPLSPMQQGLLFHTLSAPDTGAYFNQLVCTLSGHLNIPVFEQVWQQVIQRHPILRTCFRWQNLKEPVQVVLRQVQLPFKHYNWQSFSAVEQQDKLAAFLESDRTLGIDLTQAPLMRLVLIQLSENTYQFVWNTHHLIIDGWSTSLLLEEVFRFYTAFCQGEELRLEPKRPFRDYIKWLQQQDLQRAETFWRQTLSGFSAPTSLRIEKMLGSKYSKFSHHATQQIKLSASQTAVMRSLVRQHKITLNTLVQGAWAWLLSYYSGEKDVIFGVTVSGRPVTLAGAESMIGLFINTLPLRVQVSDDTSVVALLKQIQAQQAEISQYEYSPLVQVQGWSEVPRGISLFDSILVFENYPVDTSKQQIDNLEILNVFVDERTNYPLTVTVIPNQELLVEIAYECDRFDDDAITRMLGHLSNLLAGMVANPEKRLSDLSLLTAAEKQTLLVEWNNTEIEYPQDKCIHQLFEAQVEKTPYAVAVVYENKYLTYQQLNQKANQLAHYLRKQGVKPEVLVGICVERSLEMIVGLLAILKAGGAYLPLDPVYPQERLAYMLADAQVSVLLTQESLFVNFLDTSAKIICTDNAELIAQQPQTNPINLSKLDNLVYVIYTSGSTGKPKGVMIEQESLVNYTQAAIREYGIKSSDRILQFASISFDAAAEEIFPCLIQGATLVLRTNEMLTSIPHFLEKCQQQSLTVLDLPTAFWQQLISELTVLKLTLPLSLRLVIIGGEKVSVDKVLTWQKYVDSNIQLINSYGPTEATVVATTCDLSRQDFSQEVPIGKPISNIQTYILDRYLQPVPIGVIGELYIGGKGLARGYCNQPELTVEKFIPNPFEEGKRLYKTGDLVRYCNDANIEIIGRIDHQVKIRGFRIELEEIETKLNQHFAVQDAVVIVREDSPGDKRLVAYIVPNTQNLELDNKSEFTLHLRQLLKASLPEYMVPSAFVIQDKLPLTTNGKIDKRALTIPDYYLSNNETKYIAPRTPIEKELANIWTELLKVKQVGIEDNFFDLGGHSLLLTQLVFRVRQTWQIELPLSSLWEMPTIALLAESIEMAQKMGDSTIAITPKNKINWQAETVLDSVIRPHTPTKFPTEPANIFLTGVTGFVGAFLLYELLQKTNADIYCLVRADNSEEGKKRIQNSLKSYLIWDNSFNSRTIPIVGNLSEPLLGVSKPEFQALAELIDVIYHNGALVNHASPYHTLKPANVLGTQEVLRLASQVKVKPVHFMSTDGVFSPAGYSGVKVVREQDSLDDYQVPFGGYTQSKWVAEKLVTIARDRGLPVCIYRIGRVSGHSKTGVFNQNDFLYRLIIGCIKLEKAPQDNMIEDIAPVDYVSKAIVHLSRQEKSIGKAFHFVNPQPFHSSKLIKLLRSLGYPLQQISNEQWRADLLKIAESYPEHPLYPLVPLLINKDSNNSNHTWAELKFDCQNTLDGLANTSIFCPPIDENLLSVYLQYLMQQDFLEVRKHEFINI